MAEIVETDEPHGKEQFVEISKEAHQREQGAIGIDVALLAGVAANTDDFEVSIAIWCSVVADGMALQTLVREARDANDEERGMTVMQALRRYPKAIAWSFVLSTAIIMEG